jgi:hypothetical protein
MRRTAQSLEVMPSRASLPAEKESPMRVVLGCSLVVLVACGGAPKPAATEPSDTASLESTSSAAAPGSEQPSAAAPASASAASSPPPSSSAAATASPDTSAAAAPAHPAPASTGAIDGQPFAPKFAQVAGPVTKDGRRLVMLHEGTECASTADASKPGMASMMLMVPWNDGFKVDLASLKRAKKNDLGEAAFVRIAANKKKEVSATFKPTGLVTVVSAPTKKDGVGKMKIDLQNGDYLLVGDLEINNCSTK